MSEGPDPAAFLERRASEELLADDGRWLPESIGRPPASPPTPARRKLVTAGAAMTGLTLIGGVALILAAGVDAISSGFGALAVAAVVLGIILVATHWGWVHVAEFSANQLEGRRHAAIDATRHRWLAGVEPYTRYEVTTQVDPDGSLTIATVRHRPVPVGEHHFKFEREVQAPERHSHDAPAAVIAERAEQRRREAALMTERERARFQEAFDVHQRALLGRQSEEELLRERRAASEALSHQINTNLRDPPLTE